MASKPAGLTYGIDDKVPGVALALLALQHIFLMSSTIVLPVVLVSEIGGSFTEVREVVALTMIACGIGTILQALRLPGLGSGFLCPNLCGPNFFSASMSAAWLGGLPLMRGMTLFAGVVEILFARFIHRIAFLFPTEVTGLVVFMVGVGLVPVGVSNFLHIDFSGEPIDRTAVVVAAITLGIIMGLNVWGGSRIKLYALLIGMAAGYGLSALTGELTMADYQQVSDAPWFGIPDMSGVTELRFDWSLAPLFVIISICGALKSYGNLVLCEKVNDDGWTAPDMRRIGNGLTADGLCVALSGLIGGLPSDTSASNVTFSASSGATARVIGFAAGGLFAALGLSPKLSALLSIMPAPVSGAILVYVVSFMMISGLLIMLANKPDTRKTFVLGAALCFGLSLDILPQLYVGVASWLRPLFGSSLTLATVVAIVLFQLLRFGADKTAKEAAPVSE